MAFLLLVLTLLILAATTAVLQSRAWGGEELRGLASTDSSDRQLPRHLAVLDGIAPNPWQYRVLSEYVVEGLLMALQAAHMPDATVVGFVGVRILQNVVIFALAARYYRLLGFSFPQLLLAISVLAWSFTNSYYGSDLSFNTYSDVLFYLLAAVLILQQKHGWIIPITVLAAANRETSGLIPVLLLAYAWFCMPPGPRARRSMLLAGVALGAYGLVYVGLRQLYPDAPPYGVPYGLGLALHNLTGGITWLQFVATFGMLPLLALWHYGDLPRPLTVWLWTLVPAWFGIHLVGAVMAETRLFLVPLALVLLPAALVGWELIRWPAEAASVEARTGLG